MTNGQIVGRTNSCTFGHRVGRPVSPEHVTAPVTDQARIRDLRIGFENSLPNADGATYADNAASVATLVKTLKRIVA